ncbi:hypothetical protein K439DRAFT_1630998 [Ramaria rubella]|nr:hypothetical protein K439DRAFT_1630998 [Ramaria rubella]
MASPVPSVTMQFHRGQGPSKGRRRACNECRRLKLRCDMIFPCTSCRKRGCAAVCPDGSFLKGTRSLKVPTSQLYDQIQEITAGVLELEDKLAATQSLLSPEPHPLLVDSREEEQAESSIPATSVEEHDFPPDELDDEVFQVLGSPTLQKFGISQFHGETTSSKLLLPVTSTQRGIPLQNWDPGPRLYGSLPANIVLSSGLFPFSQSMPREPANIDEGIPWFPNYPQALHLRDIYFTYFSWCCMIISPGDVDSIVEEVYPKRQVPTTLHPESLQRFSLLMMVFALGALFDFNEEIGSDRAEIYHTFARAALCTEQIFSKTTVLPVCVQSMSLMVWYMSMTPGKRSYHYMWMFSGLLLKLVQAIGLHRLSPAETSPEELLRRQTTFWEFISIDIWQSLEYGRPTSMVSSQIDSNMPEEVGNMPDGAGSVFHLWKYHFMKVLGDVLVQTTYATATNYSSILDLERKLYDIPVPPELELPEVASPGGTPIALILQRYVIRLWRNTTAMYIHRRFLVLALRIHPGNLATSLYAPSVFTAFTSASMQILDLQQLYITQPLLVARLHQYWSHAFSASVILGALVTFSPSCEYAARAMQYFDLACELFENAVGRSIQPAGALEFMHKLQIRARSALNRSTDTNSFHALDPTFSLEDLGDGWNTHFDQNETREYRRASAPEVSSHSGHYEEHNALLWMHDS